MPKREYILFLKDIIEEIERIKKFISTLEKLEDLSKNELVFYAVLKALENIGEASKMIPNEIKNKYLYFWREISGLRDIIVHHYWGLDKEIIYDILENELDELEKVTKTILENEE